MTTAVSVIVPVYNSERHLAQCLDSILSQSLKNIEIICVDDGSTDSSAQILKQYSERDSRLHVLTQPNSHCGVARNNALTIAQGEYVIFWDSDDFFEPEALEMMYNRAVSYWADICVCGINKYYQNSGELLASPGNLRMALTGGQEVFNRLTIERYILNFTITIGINKLLRRQFILENELRFTDGLYAEDVIFYNAAMCLAERITCVNRQLVNYRTGQSTSQTDKVGLYPTVSPQQWRLCALYLKERNIFPEQSFENRLVAALLHDLRNMRSRDSFIAAHSYLQANCLQDMSLKPREAGYYDNENLAMMAEHLISDEPGQFYDALFYYHYEQSVILRDRLRNRLISLRQRNKEIENLRAAGSVADRKLRERGRQIRELKGELNRSKQDLNQSRQEYQALRESQDRTQKQLAEVQGEIEELRSSLAYRMARWLTWLPRKLRELMKGKE